MSANTTEAIDLLAGNVLEVGIFGVLAFLAIGLTVAMFITRESMLGFPCAIFWAIFGAYCYTQSVTAWGDIYYFMFFAGAFGMTIFTIIVAFGLREKRDTIADDELEKGEGERSGEEKNSDDETQPSERTKRLRERAKRRRNRASK